MDCRCSSPTARGGRRWAHPPPTPPLLHTQKSFSEPLDLLTFCLNLWCDGQIPVAVRFCEKRAEFFVVTGRTACSVDAHNGVLKKEFNHIMNHEISACAIDPDVNKVRTCTYIGRRFA